MESFEDNFRISKCQMANVAAGKAGRDGASLQEDLKSSEYLL